MRKLPLVLEIVGALIFGLLIGFADARAKEVQGTVLVIMVATFVSGFLQPRLAWLWAMLIGGGIFGVQVIYLLLQVTPPSPAQPNAFAALIALVPALVGAYTGVAGRWLVYELRAQGKDA